MEGGRKSARRRVGVLGFGALGQYLVKGLLEDAAASSLYELVFVWNRSLDKMRTPESDALIKEPIAEDLILEKLEDFESRKPDLIVEVAHPVIYANGMLERMLNNCDVFVGSPTGFSDPAVSAEMNRLIDRNNTTTKGGMFVPCGALWGAEDIAKMGKRGTITALKITMTKPAQSMRLLGQLGEDLEKFQADDTRQETTLYEGPVRGLCPFAPNNVNTMACAAMASGPNVGFDGAIGILRADKKLKAHVIEVEVTGKPLAGRDDPFVTSSKRYNPCDPKAVTASATYPSFLSSLINAAPGSAQKGKGLHFC